MKIHQKPNVKSFYEYNTFFFLYIEENDKEINIRRLDTQIIFFFY